VTQRLSNTSLYRDLNADRAALAAAGVELLLRTGDCVMPRMALADAIFDAHRLAREIDSENPRIPRPFIREDRVLGARDEDYDAILELDPASQFIPKSSSTAVTDGARR
jgi:dimethylamine/trimethylamine dehydrogenase